MHKDQVLLDSKACNSARITCCHSGTTTASTYVVGSVMVEMEIENARKEGESLL